MAGGPGGLGRGGFSRSGHHARRRARARAGPACARCRSGSGRAIAAPRYLLRPLGYVKVARDCDSSRSCPALPPCKVHVPGGLRHSPRGPGRLGLAVAGGAFQRPWRRICRPHPVRIRCRPVRRHGGACRLRHGMIEDRRHGRDRPEWPTWASVGTALVLAPAGWSWNGVYLAEAASRAGDGDVATATAGCMVMTFPWSSRTRPLRRRGADDGRCPTADGGRHDLCRGRSRGGPAVAGSTAELALKPRSGRVRAGRGATHHRLAGALGTEGAGRRPSFSRKPQATRAPASRRYGTVPARTGGRTGVASAR